MHEKTKEIVALLESRYGTKRGWKSKAANDLGIERTTLSDVFSGRYNPDKKFYERLRVLFPNFVSKYEQTDTTADYSIVVSEQKHEYKESDTTFSVTVKDDNLSGLGIFSGDVVMVDLGKQVKDNDIVFAEMNRELVLRLYRDGLLLTVPPSGHLAESFILTSNIKILGVVVAFTRYLT